MKNKIAVTLLLLVLLVGVISSSFFAFPVSVAAKTTPKPTPTSTPTPLPSFKSFTLTAIGKAYDTKTGKYITGITLTLSGSASGTLKTIINLNIKGVDFNVPGYSDITISSGSGYIISSCKYNQFSLIITGQYGGQVACALLCGTVTLKSSNTVSTTLSMTLCSDTVVLPFQGHPTLKNLQLIDTITLTY